MTDPHLNLFYSYNQDNELIENKLTRAFIVSLCLLSPGARGFLLQRILNTELQKFGVPSISYQNVGVALQANLDRRISRQAPYRFLVTIASERIVIEDEEGTAAPGSKTYQSIPDAWLIDQDSGCCFLIESKVGSNPISEPQIQSHADKWLGIDPNQLSNHLISLTWVDVIRAIEYLKRDTISSQLNPQELTLLGELVAFLGFYGYRIFRGFSWTGLQAPARFHIRRRKPAYAQLGTPSGLKSPPEFRIPVKTKRGN